MKPTQKNQNPAASIHILGIAGTFMGGVAQLAKAKGFKVSGSDKAIYPPMSTQLEQAGIEITPYDSDTCLDLSNATFPDCIVIGNALSRGHALVEATLNAQQKYTSGPQWLAEQILHDRWVVAVAGTHGKTTTASMVVWVLEFAGLNPGFLIGGVPENFGVSARLGASPFFVVEADEYDTAFFDKRSKFVHYRPRTCVINNLEFDHADIFEDLGAIQKQFNHLVRTVPGNGLIIQPSDEPNVDAVIAKGCWSGLQTQGEQGDWSYRLLAADGSEFEVLFKGELKGSVHWEMTGLHSVRNGLSAIAAALHCGVPVQHCLDGLSRFKGVRRRMTLIGETAQGIKIYDDFAHHPTAIETTLLGARNSLEMAAQMSRPGHFSTEKGRLIAVFEPRSNTMRMGVHTDNLPASFACADAVFAFIDPEWQWQLPTDAFTQAVTVANSYASLLDALLAQLQPNDTVVMMSNGSFGGLHQRLFSALNER